MTRSVADAEDVIQDVFIKLNGYESKINIFTLNPDKLSFIHTQYKNNGNRYNTQIVLISPLIEDPSSQVGDGRVTFSFIFR